MRNFTSEDFTGCGQYLVKIGPQEMAAREAGQTSYTVQDTGYLATMLYKVGWGVAYEKEDGSSCYYLALVSMTDGMVTNRYKPSASEDWTFITGSAGITAFDVFADFLNTGMEEYRFATQEEVVRVILYQTSKTT